jgi:serine/threonine protein kinase/Tfp pilus assembly protein PilF
LEKDMIGKLISHYRIIEKIGAGGMGEVYLAEDLRLERKVAIKFLPQHLTKDKENVERFEREAKATAALYHPNIITIYEIAEDDNQTFIVMEYIDGQSLRTKIENGFSELDEILDITKQICGGLSEAHKADIVHRDIKPENILIDRSGHVKILDFGLAKLKGVSKLTKETSTLGTIHYMSPEQVQGQEVNHRSDIWSLGIVFYEMLTRKLPFKGDYEQAVIYSIMNDEPESPSNIKYEIPVELDPIIKKILNKNPQQRYQNIDGLISDLDALNADRKSNYTSKEKDKNQSKKSRRNIILGLTVFISIIIVAIGYIFLNKSPETNRVIDSVAVLPLENMSGDPDQEYFSDGMTEALITELSRIKALKVISRTSVMRFKNTQKPIPEIAKQLNVEAVIEGSVLKAGDKVRITAQLIDATSDKHLWAESYERDMREILSLQKEVAKTIASQIKATLAPSEKNELSKMPTINPLAHEAFLKGHYFFDQTSVDDAWKAIKFFDQAIQIEPDFAPAYAGKALAYDLIVSYNAMTPKKGWPLVREWAEKALSIDKTNSDAVLSIADVEFIYEWDWAGSDKAYQRSIELNPNNSEAYTWYASFLSSMGREDEALLISKKSLELAPLSIGPYYNGIIVRIEAGLFEEAEVLMNKVKELFPQHPVSFGIEGLICIARGKYKEALGLYQLQLTKELSPGMKDLARTRLAYVLARIGNEKASREILESLINKSPKHYISSLRIALIYIALDEKDQAFTWLDRAYLERCDDLPVLIKTSFIFNEIRPDPRFQDLLKRMKLDK